ncbi:MAG TPA: MBL fold metallo-hydrolase [Bryobacteraceae bacterium]|nr:MBL fold metallo-hydrolase [Bryobacteraceae bacterium]
MFRSISLALAAAFLPAAAFALDHPPPKKIPVAGGIVLFVTAPYGEVGLDGNSVVIFSPEGVLVFDSNGTPAAAAAVLAEIRKLTDQPVRYLVNSHWHWDHWYGSEVYRNAFPGVRIIAQEKTRTMMMGPALEFNRPGIEKQLPAYISSLEKQPATPEVTRRIEQARYFLDQKAHVQHTFPNVTYTSELDIHLGDREIQVLHYDRAVTPGDSFLYLPKEKIVVTGDLLVNPISFALSCYPNGWLKTLERIDRLDASILIPGHGEPLHDKRLLRATMEVFRELLRRGKESKDRGLDPDQARATILPALKDLMVQITGGEPALNRAFEIQLVDWYLHRVYEELDGPLSDDIGRIPPA